MFCAAEKIEYNKIQPIRLSDSKLSVRKKSCILFLEKMKEILVFLLLLVFYININAQNIGTNKKIVVSRLLDSLWINPNSFISYDAPNWKRLNEHLENVDFLQMNEIIHSVFFGKNSFMLNKSHAYDGFIGTLNKSANEKKIKKYHKKIKKGFRDRQKYPNNKVVLIEGDSWFEYPIFLKDITDYLVKEPNLAVYSHAHGSDWIANMISSLQYEYDYMKIKPDIFIISGGGNDVLGDDRLSNFLLLEPLKKNNPEIIKYKEYVKDRLLYYSKANLSSTHSIVNPIDTVLLNQIVNGRRYLNKNTYRFLASLKIEYAILFESLQKVNPEKFKQTKIITQGYDYAIPSYKRKFGSALLFSNGNWLKEPLMMNGIVDEQTEQDIVKTIIFEMNEMLIEFGKEYNNVYHVDIRGFTSFYEQLKHKKYGFYWHDELHPKSIVFKKIADIYYDIIENKIPENKKVINAKAAFLQKHKNIY